MGIVGKGGFLGKAQSARWAVPLLRPNSAQIVAQARLFAESWKSRSLWL